MPNHSSHTGCWWEGDKEKKLRVFPQFLGRSYHFPFCLQYIFFPCYYWSSSHSSLNVFEISCMVFGVKSFFFEKFRVWNLCWFLQHTQPPKTPEAQYAKPNKVSKSPTGTSKGVDQLDSMLGTLQSDMSKQGVNTSPKGHCTACNKPIVGQVSWVVFILLILAIASRCDASIVYW